MPIPHPVTRFNRAIANPIIRRFAGIVAPLAIVEHRGRRSGARYRTPVLAFPDGDEMVFALTYGTDVDWAKNVITAGGCTLERRRRSIRLTDPQPEHGPPPAAIPSMIDPFLRLLRVRDYLRLRVVA